MLFVGIIIFVFKMLLLIVVAGLFMALILGVSCWNISDSWSEFKRCYKTSLLIAYKNIVGK